jgi:D-glycero-D-manno-heptose 1,7-bisphosphate phosphatase
MKRAAFLDRDGVVNRATLLRGVPRPPASINEVEILEDVVTAIELLKAHHFVPVVVTNQPDVARGTTSQTTINEINAHISMLTGIEHFYTCIHDDGDLCGCRKPKPGLIIQSATELGLDIHSSILVGDRWRDVSAGQAAGCRTFFIDHSYGERPPEQPFSRVSSLLEAVKKVLGDSNESSN